ncbi:hypothetical protein THO17_07170 [Marinomonas sp. THO17]
MHEFTYELGFAIQGIYRIVAGAVVMVLVLELLDHGLVGYWKAAVVSGLILSLACYSFSVMLTRLKIKTAP